MSLRTWQLRPAWLDVVSKSEHAGAVKFVPVWVRPLLPLWHARLFEHVGSLYLIVGFSDEPLLASHFAAKVIPFLVEVCFSKFVLQHGEARVGKPEGHVAGNHLSRFIERELVEPLINPAFDLKPAFGRHSFPFGASL